MKTTPNKSPKASSQLVNSALSAGINASVIERSKPRTRRYSANGSTASPQKVVVFDGMRMSLAQAGQYLLARGNDET